MTEQGPKMICRARYGRKRLVDTVLTGAGRVLLPQLHAGYRLVIIPASDNEQRDVSYDIDTWIPHHNYAVENP